MGLGQIQPKSGHGAIFQNEIRNRFRKILKIINGRWPRKTIEIMEGGGLVGDSLANCIYRSTVFAVERHLPVSGINRATVNGICPGLPQGCREG